MSTILEWVMYLWARPPRDIAVPCPYVDGMPYDPEGFISQAAIASRWNLTFVIALGLVILALFVCYSATAQSTGPSFARRWVGFLLGSSLLAGVVAGAVVLLLPYEVAAGTCDTAPGAFMSRLPSISLAIQVLVWRLVWALLAFTVLSLAATRIFGRASWAGGFFHNRGTPYPRFLTGRRGS